MPAKKKTPAKKVTNTAANSAAKKTTAKKTSKKTIASPTAVVARSGVKPEGDKKATPIVFSIDDIEELMASKKKSTNEAEAAKPSKVKEAPKVKATKTIIEEKPVEKRVLGAASLADILGFNPSETKNPTALAESEIPSKWKKYYDLLIELRNHVSEEIDLHTSDTLKHSSRDDSGDLSSYGNHQADAGTDTFDRDFALSLVSAEQDALHEIEEAITRIKDGSYGVCEVTNKPIPAARLTAVPFARYSVEGQAEYEKNNRRRTDRNANLGIFGDVDAPKIASSDDEDE